MVPAGLRGLPILPYVQRGGSATSVFPTVFPTELPAVLARPVADRWSIFTPDMAGGLRRARWQTATETVALVVIAVAVAWMALARSTSRIDGRTTGPRPTPADPALPGEPIPLAGAQVMGSPSAKAGLVVYSDFQCPFCGKFARETLPILDEQYVRPGKLLVAFRQFPLPNRPVAMKAAEAAICAGDQGRFWEMHDWIFGNPRTLTPAGFRSAASALNLNAKAFASCLARGATDRVSADRQTAASLPISGTPTAFVGVVGVTGNLKAVRRLAGAKPLAEFIAAIDAALGEDPGSTPRGQATTSPR